MFLGFSVSPDGTHRANGIVSGEVWPARDTHIATRPKNESSGGTKQAFLSKLMAHLTARLYYVLKCKQKAPLRLAILGANLPTLRTPPENVNTWRSNPRKAPNEITTGAAHTAAARDAHPDLPVPKP